MVNYSSIFLIGKIYGVDFVFVMYLLFECIGWYLTGIEVI